MFAVLGGFGFGFCFGVEFVFIDIVSLVAWFSLPWLCSRVAFDNNTAFHILIFHLHPTLALLITILWLILNKVIHPHTYLPAISTDSSSITISTLISVISILISNFIPVSKIIFSNNFPDLFLNLVVSLVPGSFSLLFLVSLIYFISKIFETLKVVSLCLEHVLKVHLARWAVKLFSRPFYHCVWVLLWRCEHVRCRCIRVCDVEVDLSFEFCRGLVFWRLLLLDLCCCGIVFVRLFGAFVLWHHLGLVVRTELTQHFVIDWHFSSDSPVLTFLKDLINVSNKCVWLAENKLVFRIKYTEVRHKFKVYLLSILFLQFIILNFCQDAKLVHFFEEIFDLFRVGLG